MTSILNRHQPAAIALILILLFAASTAALAQAKKPSLESKQLALIAADPMSPVNPFNGGVDPMTMPDDARIGVFPYSRDQIYKVLSAPLKLTTIEFEKGEALVGEPAMGDSIQWEIDTDGANHVFIKPHKAGLVNTLHLTTNKREYDFTLISSPAGGFFYQTVRFQYPQSLMAKVADRQASRQSADSGATDDFDSGSTGVSPDKLNWDYSISGNAEFKPEVVFDNGHAIWMRMPANAQSWPVPMIKEHGDLLVGNFIRRGSFLVLQRLSDEVILVSGKDEVTVKRGGPRFLGLF
jgi:P-type conjugative transfer protein TrbG